jgi:ADP-ribose pyrophosphatase YjhB (NUDIX family)
VKRIDGITWLLIRDGRVLLEKCPKKAAKLGVGVWFVPGGKVEGNETARDACMREMAEEWPSVDVIELRPLPIIEGSRVGAQVDGEDVFLMRPYLIRVRGSIPSVSADGIELRWVAVEEALSSPVPQVRMMVAAAVVSDDFKMEKDQFARDVEPDDDGDRPQIDPFRYRRYLALGWISDRSDETPPYYSLTANGELIWRSHRVVNVEEDWS